MLSLFTILTGYSYSDKFTSLWCLDSEDTAEWATPNSVIRSHNTDIDGVREKVWHYVCIGDGNDRHLAYSCVQWCHEDGVVSDDSILI